MNKELAKKLFEEARCEHILSMLIRPPKNNRGEFGLLAYLKYQQNGCTAGEISRELSVSTARVAFSLNVLESKGYIVRKLDPNDKRKVLVFLTEMGETKIQEETDNVIKLLTFIIDELGSERFNDYFKTACEIKKITNNYYKEER